MRGYDPGKIGCYAGWRRYEGNPVIDERMGEVSDAAVLQEDGHFRMYYSHRYLKKILLAAGEDGLEFRPYADGAVTDEETDTKAYIVGSKFYDDGGDYGYTLTRRPELGWEAAVCQPYVLKQDGVYHLFYVGKRYSLQQEDYDRTVIAHGVSRNGQNWKVEKTPVLEPDQLWEKDMLSYPSVLWDPEEKLYKMWYSGADADKPSAIGYAVSQDAVTWRKPYTGPIFRKDNSTLERERVGACHVLKWDGWYYMFYTAWQDEYKSRICLARSRDGVHDWERHPQNPVVTWGQFGAWDVESVCRPYALYMGNRWYCYYTGQARGQHRIGVLVHEGEDLGFGGGL